MWSVQTCRHGNDDAHTPVGYRRRQNGQTGHSTSQLTWVKGRQLRVLKRRVQQASRYKPLPLSTLYSTLRYGKMSTKRCEWNVA